MNASWPATWNSPSRLIRRRRSCERDAGRSTMTARPGRWPARQRAARTPVSPSQVSSTTLSVSIQNLVGDRRHRHRSHAKALLQGAKMIEDGAQERQVFLQIDAEIVRMPPQVKQPVAARRSLHGRGDAPQPQALQRGIARDRPQEAAGGHIDHAAVERRLVIVRTSDRQVAVEEPRAAHEQILLAVAACCMEPDALVAAERPQSELAANRQMLRADLIARKHDARELDAESRGRRSRSLEVGAEGLDVAALLQAIEVRERVRADLLARTAENPPDQRQPVVVWIMLFVRSDFGEIFVG